MKRYVLLFALFCCIGSLAEIKATGQEGDRLIIGEDTLELLDTPLEYDSLLRRKVDNRLLKEALSTGCWRRYIATWRIENNKLYLEAIKEYEVLKGRKPDVNLEGIFDAYKDEQGRILASWFTAKTYTAAGKRIRYWNSHFHRNYEKETMYDIQNGIVIDEQHYRNYIKRSSIGGVRSFDKAINANFNGDLFPDLADKKLTVNLSVLPDANGRIDSLEILNWEINNKKVIPFAANHPYVTELMKCLTLIPDWQVSFIRGKIEKVMFTIDLWNKKGCRSISWREESNDYIDIDQKRYSLRAFPLQYDTQIYARLLAYLPVNVLRNYTAVWEVVDDRLFLKSIQLWNAPNLFPLEKIFPEARPGEPIEATWYSGETLSTVGKELFYSEYYPIEIFSTFKKGRLTSQTAYQNYTTPMSQQSYERCHQSLRSLNWNLESEFIGKNIEVFCRAFPNKNGKAEKMEIEITVEGVGKEKTKYTITDPNNSYIKACRKALEQAIWEVQRKRGEVFSTYECFTVQRIKK